MNKKITKLLSVFVIAGVIGTGAAVGFAGCGGKETTHEHTPATEWQSDANGHWHNCTEDDGAKLNEGAHVYDDDQDATCNVCGYERTVTPAPTPAEPTVTSVTVTAAGNATTVANEGTLQLSAAVAGENNPAQTVTWSIKEGATATGATVSESGLLSAGTVAGSVTVVATSTVDTSKKGEITITVEAAEEELDLEVEITGLTTVAETGSITLTATVTGVPEGGETGVIWSVDDETVATITQEGVLTGVAPGTVTVTAKAKADETFYATYDVVITAASTYDKLANRADNLVAENFSSYTEGQELTAFTDWGTKGVYEKTGAKGGAVTVVGGQAKGLNTSKLDNISLMVDFGAVEGVVEGYFKYGFLATATGEGNSINFYNESGKVLTLITNGTSYVIKNIPGVGAQPTTSFTCDVNAIVEVNFKFDLTNKTVTLKLDNTVICEDLACDISELVGFEVVTSNGGLRGIVVDDIAVCGTKLTVGTYVERTNAKVAALETTYGLGGIQYTNNIKGAYESATSAATTFEEVDAAYDALYASVLTMFKNQASLYVEDLWTTGYDTDAAKVTALKETICGEIEAMTDIADVYAVLSNDFADRLEAADIHEDSYYAAVNVTVVIYEKGTTTSVVKSTADLTDKSGEEITLAALKDAIEVPSGYQIKALYSDEACTTAITGSLTLDAGGATEATTMTIYVEFEAVTSVTHTLEISATSALAETTLLNDIFYGTKNLKTESIKNGVEGYGTLQISLTSGKVAAGDAPANGIMFTVSGPTTVTVVCGQKTDKNTTLSVLNNDGTAATVSNITKNGTSVSAFETLSTTATPDTYTFTLEAGTYHLGGAGGGPYIHSLVVTETVAA